MVEKLSDLERWRSFLIEFGIGFTEYPEQDGTARLELMSSDAKVDGPWLFYADIEFDVDHKFIRVGLGE